MLIIYIIAAVAIILIIVATIILRKKSSGNTQIRAYSNDENSSFDAMTQALDKNSYEQKAIYLEDHPEECKNLHIALCDINFLGYINEHYGVKIAFSIIGLLLGIIVTPIQAIISGVNLKKYRSYIPTGIERRNEIYAYYESTTAEQSA